VVRLIRRILGRALPSAVLGGELTPNARLLLSGAFNSILIRPVGHLLRFVLAALLARLMGASGYGIYAYAVAWMGIIQIPAALGLDNVVLRYVSVYRETGESAKLKGLLRFATRAALASGILAAAAAIAVTYLIPGLDGPKRATLAITFAALPFSVFAPVRQATLRGFDQPVRGQFAEQILYPGVLVILIAVAWASKGRSLPPNLAALCNVAAWGTAFAVGTVLVLRAIPADLDAVTPVTDEKVWMSMVMPLIVSGFAYNLLSRIDLIILDHYRPDAAVGVYAVAQRLGELMLYVYEAMTMAGASLFSRVYASGDREELQEFTTLVARVILVASIPLLLVSWIFAPFILSLFGPEFVVGANTLRLLSTSYFVSSLGGFIIIMFYMAGTQATAARWMLIAAALNMLISVALIPRYGMIGAAIASGTSLIFLKGMLVWIFYRDTGVLSLPFARPARAR
jgi:O-antigen/teichoic acid export membrane protein